MKFAAISFTCALAALAGPSAAQDGGAADLAGASAMMTETVAIRAANIIRRGRVVKIGRDYRPGMQTGTRLVGPGHIGTAGRNGESGVFHNGIPVSEVVSGDGGGKPGIEHVRPFFTRGILIDMVTVRGRPMEAGDEITVDDIETALDWFGLDAPGHGDAVIFHTGWGRHWIADNGTYLAGAPGIGMAAAKWLIEREVALIGADTWSVEVQPVREGETPGALPVHLELIPKHGIFLHENLETERLIDAEIAEFAYIFTPVPVVGATASPGAPLAVY